MTVSQASNVRSLIILMFFSVACAFAIAIFSVQTFGPTGSYEVKNALITPYLLENMSYNDTDTKTGAETRFVFDQLLYTYRDTHAQKTLTKPITLQDYRRFYEVINGDSSIVDGGSNLETLFNDADQLVINVKTVTDDPLQSEKKLFQEIHFAREGNFYRIELREDMNPQEKWAYYNHLGITAAIKQLFVEKP